VLNKANQGAFRWQLAGGGWVFMRQDETQFVSPLIAATLAYDAAIRPGEQVVVSEETYDDLWDRLTVSVEAVSEDEVVAQRDPGWDAYT